MKAALAGSSVRHLLLGELRSASCRTLAQVCCIEDELAKVDSSDGYAGILRRCGNSKALSDGKRVHEHIIRHGYAGSVFLGNLLVQMYGRCGCLRNARLAFDAIAKKNVFSWSIMIAAYAQHGHCREAIDLYEKMNSEGACEPEVFVFSSILGACSSLGDLELGKRIHARIVRSPGLESNVVVETALLNMYANCGCLDEARSVFDKMEEKDVVSWNAMISAYEQHGHGKQALQLYRHMCLDGGSWPSYVTFATILSACSSLGFLAEGKRIHLQLIPRGLQSNVVVQTALLNMYAKCSSLDDAKRVFDGMQRRNVVSWNAMIAAYAQNGHYKEAFELYEKLDSAGVEPDGFTFASILGACSSLAEGNAIHFRFSSAGFQSVIVDTALVSMYAKCGSLDDARRVFEQMPERDVVAWNSMVAAYAQQGQNKEALALYQRMEPEGVHPNGITFASVLGACSNLGALEEGKLVHRHAIAGKLESAVLVETALVNMYAKCGSLDDARSLFEKMQHRDVVSWNAIIAAYTQSGHGKEALELYKRMESEGTQPDKFTFASLFAASSTFGGLEAGKAVHSRLVSSGCEPDVFVQNALLNMYAKCGSLRDAKVVFDGIPHRDVISWNAMLAAYAQYGHNKEAVELYKRMVSEKMEPNEATFASILGTVSSMGDLAEGKAIHARIAESRFKDFPTVESAVVSMYAKCGSLSVARTMFEKMQWRDVIAWNAMIAAYAQHGDGMEALELHHRMELDGTQPNAVTLIAISIACSHVGLLEQGLLYFRSLRSDHEVTLLAEHYRCMVDLLARSGRLNEAESLIEEMPFEPDAVVWMTLLAACRMHGNVVIAEHAAERLVQVDPHESASYVLLSNIYAAADRQVDIWKTKHPMKEVAEKSAEKAAEDLTL